jgi:hypothetical protein
MQSLPIQSIPNQAFSIVLDDNKWDFVIKTTNGTVSVSLSRNNIPVISNLRAVAGMRIIPAQYEESGNFAIITLNQELPDYTMFGTSQILVYISAEELALEREPSASPYIVSADFDPLGGLPKKFAPTNFIQIFNDRLLLESGGFLLLEDGGYILLEGP